MSLQFFLRHPHKVAGRKVVVEDHKDVGPESVVVGGPSGTVLQTIEWVVAI